MVMDTHTHTETQV